MAHKRTSIRNNVTTTLTGLSTTGSNVFETRIYLMFMHFSILLKIHKKRNKKFDQQIYDFFFHNIEYNLRELGFGDVFKILL